jgi:adenylosuccinate synthase
VFRQIGSGAFCGVPTFLSQHVSVNPIALLLELRRLGELGVSPEIYASPECLVTTFADMLINRRLEDARGGSRHGSCGMGISETIDRSKVAELKITMADLYNQAGLETKLAEICDRWARFRTGSAVDDPKMAESFLKACKVLPEHLFPAGIGQCKDPVFEGAQGLLLDADNAEYFPHVTRSNTGLKNVRSLCQQAGIETIDAYYVTRTYLTRHGAGTLPNEDDGLSFWDDTNAENPYQGRLRFAPLDLRALRERVRRDAGDASLKLVVTHRDQLELPDLRGDLSSYGPSREDVRSE